jgi:hypothetical protein
MSNRTLYTYNGDGHEESPILIQMYYNESFRMVAISKEDLKEGCPWVIAKALNDAYERGRAEAFDDLRSMIGAVGKNDTWR